jgi:catechol 2,3-dioxygenase-like lactoylglutathione lyase family enzyme
MGERTIPILPCRDLEETARFYEALGFVVTYRQLRPNPYVAVQRGGLDLHFFALEDFDPETSMGSAIVLVRDPGELFDAFAAGLRGVFGKLPITGIPRITRPRRKQGMAGGFTVVDPGGNWLRISSLSEDADTPTDSAGTLDRVLLNATRQGDSHGDVPTAISVLKVGLDRHADAPNVDRIPLLAYLAELYVRSENLASARSVLEEIDVTELDDAERAKVSSALSDVEELRRTLS